MRLLVTALMESVNCVWQKVGETEKLVE